MTDLRRLSDLPELHPRPGQADAALRLVHDRRRRAALRTASTAGALAVVTALLTSRGPSVSMLEQTDEGVTKTATAVPSPTGHGGETDSAAGPRLATPAGGGPADPAAAPDVTSHPGGTAPPEPGASGAAEPGDRRPRPRPDVRRVEHNAVMARLDDEGPPPSCTPTPGNTSCGGIMWEKSGDGILFRVTICSGGEGYTLAFAGEQEVDLVVRSKDGREVWRWGRGVDFGDNAHEIVLDTEECVSWFLPWDYGDEAGARVPAGDYRVEMPVRSTPGHLFGSPVRID